VVSDCVSNSIRVTKTMKQSSKEAISYGEAIRTIVKQDGMVGLFTRGTLHIHKDPSRCV